MGTIFVAVASCTTGLIGRWIGDFFGVGAAFAPSVVASVVGIHYGNKWNREHFSQAPNFR